MYGAGRGFSGQQIGLAGLGKVWENRPPSLVCPQFSHREDGRARQWMFVGVTFVWPGRHSNQVGN
jgi:hypothetical protein